MAARATRILQRSRQTGQAPFHVPGHKRGQGTLEQFGEVMGPASLCCDLTELAGLDYLASPTGCIAEAQDLAASAFGAQRTWFLVNGSTVGIQAAILAACGEGGDLLAARNCHASAFSAMVLAGCKPWYVQPEFDAELGIAHGVTPAALRAAFLRIPPASRPTAAIVVSPTYFGVCSDIAGLAGVCRQFGAALIVDEAHGSHFAFHENFPQAALAAGADLVIQSSHKTLSALTQAAMLHQGRGSGVPAERISGALLLLQSSSPSYLLLASLDAARAHAQVPASSCEPLQAAEAIRQSLDGLPGIGLLDERHISRLQLPSGTAEAMDPLRLTLSFGRLGLTGQQAAALLEADHGVVPELATQQVVVLALGPGTTGQHAKQLVAALKSLCCSYPMRVAADSMAPQSAQPMGRPDLTDLSFPEHVLTPRQAVFAPTQRVALEDAVGHVSAETMCPYPPGVPVLVPGERIGRQAIQQLCTVLENGGTVTGASDSTLQTVLVVA
ncbi:hypothetical protein WJX72_006835 [[Myrmecia] bisecta]|uniref:Arginine decarboxylase n=1 Tax=[Myrmecia] bisecta TaxID=41462 RepID=A0AAW1PW51_9CHLO